MLRSSDILFGMLLPFGIAIVALALIWRPWQKREVTTQRSRWIAGMGMVIAFAAAYVLMQGILPRPVRFPPTDSTHWLLFYTPVLALAAVVDALIRLKWPVRTIGALLLAGGIAFLLFMKPSVNGPWIAGGAIAVTLLILAAEHASTRATGIAMPVVLTVFASAAAIVIGTSGSQKGALVAGAMAAAIGASVPIALWHGKGFSLARGGGAVIVAVVCGAAVLIGARFASVTLPNLMLVLASPVVAWAATLLPLKRGHWRTLLIVAAGSAPALAAAIMAAIQFRRDADELLLMM